MCVQEQKLMWNLSKQYFIKKRFNKSYKIDKDFEFDTKIVIIHKGIWVNQPVIFPCISIA